MLFFLGVTITSRIIYYPKNSNATVWNVIVRIKFANYRYTVIKIAPNKAELTLKSKHPKSIKKHSCSKQTSFQKTSFWWNSWGSKGTNVSKSCRIWQMLNIGILREFDKCWVFEYLLLTCKNRLRYKRERALESRNCSSKNDSALLIEPSELVLHHRGCSRGGCIGDFKERGPRRGNGRLWWHQLVSSLVRQNHKIRL